MKTDIDIHSGLDVFMIYKKKKKKSLAASWKMYAVSDKHLS